ncbi:MAG: rRNA maturation RNase YbeY [Clostridiaceae bacterium]
MKNLRSKSIDETRIFIENEQSAMPFENRQTMLLEKTALACLRSENIDIGCEINIMISDDPSIRQINHQFRNIDSSTDVLSFPMVDMKDGMILSKEGDYDLDEGLLLLGDIVISIETAKRQAEQYGHSLERELAFLASHGIFHLLGYDHIAKDEEMRMMSKQEAVLDQLGLKRI